MRVCGNGANIIVLLNTFLPPAYIEVDKKWLVLSDCFNLLMNTCPSRLDQSTTLMNQKAMVSLYIAALNMTWSILRCFTASNIRLFTADVTVLASQRSTWGMSRSSEDKTLSGQVESFSSCIRQHCKSQISYKCKICMNSSSAKYKDIW